MRRVASDGEGGDEADTEEGTLLQSTLLNLGDSSGQLRQLEEYMVRHVGLAAEAGGLKHASTALMWRMLEITRPAPRRWRRRPPEAPRCCARWWPGASRGRRS